MHQRTSYAPYPLSARKTHDLQVARLGFDQLGCPHDNQERTQRYDRPEIATVLVQVYPRLRDRLKSRTLSVLLSRKTWALALLEEVDAGRIAAKEIPVDELRAVAQFRVKRLNDLVRKRWGDIQSGTCSTRDFPGSAASIRLIRSANPASR
jgi:hypothetical protein